VDIDDMFSQESQIQHFRAKLLGSLARTTAIGVITTAL